MPLAAADWLVLALYFAVVLAIGTAAARRSSGRDEFFLAGRGMPVWAVALSVLATSLSAATFIGGPQQAYAGDLRYLSTNLGGVLAAIVVAGVFIPAFYRAGVTSIYELLGATFGAGAGTAASAMFMVGRIFASGARLFMVAIPVALVVFGDLRPQALALSIAAVAAVAAAYTMAGGIRAVIWTDALQAVVVIGTVGAALWILWRQVAAGGADAWEALPAEKLRVLSLGTDPGDAYTLWTALVGFTLFSTAAFGTDQDLTQRMLTCRSAARGAWSMVLYTVLSWPVVSLFLGLGLLLYLRYPPETVGDTRRIFLRFILEEMPPGLRGLMLAGLFAAAMSSLDSALNAMASTTVADFYRPWRRRRGGEDDPRAEAGVARLAVGGWAVVLAAFACFCIWWQQARGDTLIDFALGVMVFAYGGLLGVFLVALLTRRGNAATAVAALAAGFVAVILLQWTDLAFPWQMTVATGLSFAVCAAGPRRAESPAEASG